MLLLLFIIYFNKKKHSQQYELCRDTEHDHSNAVRGIPTVMILTEAARYTV